MDIDFEQIWEVYRAKLLHFVKGRVKDPDTAEDILQDVFVKTIEKIDTLQSKEKLQSWLFQITRNSIVDHYRSRKTEPNISPPPPCLRIKKNINTPNPKIGKTKDNTPHTALLKS